jgi:hypothetical protein
MSIAAPPGKMPLTVQSAMISAMGFLALSD